MSVENIIYLFVLVACGIYSLYSSKKNRKKNHKVPKPKEEVMSFHNSVFSQYSISPDSCDKNIKESIILNKEYKSLKNFEISESETNSVKHSQDTKEYQFKNSLNSENVLDGIIKSAILERKFY